jgi:hypothetical protein
VFYRGVQFPEEHQGSYFFGDLCAPWIKTLSADYEVADFAVNTAGGIVDLEVGPDGSSTISPSLMGQCTGFSLATAATSLL